MRLGANLPAAEMVGAGYRSVAASSNERRGTPLEIKQRLLDG